jgi:hypothetical protein
MPVYRNRLSALSVISILNATIGMDSRLQAHSTPSRTLEATHFRDSRISRDASLERSDDWRNQELIACSKSFAGGQPPGEIEAKNLDDCWPVRGPRWQSSEKKLCPGEVNSFEAIVRTLSR